MYETLIIQAVREHYAIEVEEVELLSHSNKMVYQIRTSNDEAYIFDIHLNQHKEGRMSNKENEKYYTEDAIASEAHILHVLNREYPELRSPAPIRNKAGQLVSSITIQGIDALCTFRKYIAGRELKKDTSEAYLQQAYEAGIIAAKIHQCSNQHFNDMHLSRPIHKQPHVQRIVDTIRLGIDVGTITPAQFDIVNRSLAFVMHRMDEMDKDAPYYVGIVHTDLRDANLLFDGERVIPIDFGRCVYGYLLYDLGEMSAHMGGDEVPVLQQLIRGYHSIRKLTPYDLVTIEAFRMLFILSVVAEQILQRDNSYVATTLQRLTEADLVNLLSDKPVIQGIRDVI
ncbi:phosphotransferase enzyme family protein [Paenibacillus albus]|uniref:Aminoglycoside phosphotransferase domain-containing protein n=1 Tax=Paenibacillus albus TaxID=2495582 RepID=A0A3Q8X4A6_9BACL|nr:phosphotransferase [Paenibacillus albus]AZN40122.1 hypothetical protein EJC50_11015 [Paenibacillus albus]